MHLQQRCERVSLPPTGLQVAAAANMAAAYQSAHSALREQFRDRRAHSWIGLNLISEKNGKVELFG